MEYRCPWCGSSRFYLDGGYEGDNREYLCCDRCKWSAVIPEKEKSLIEDQLVQTERGE